MKVLRIVTMIGIPLGITLMLISLVKMNALVKRLNDLNDGEVIPDDITKGLIKFTNLIMAGNIVMFIFGIIQILSRNIG